MLPNAEYLNSGDTANHQPSSPDHDSMDVDPVHTVTNSSSNIPPHVPNTAPETTPSPPLDPDLVADESGTDLSTGGPSLPDPSPPSPRDVPQQPSSLATQAKLPSASTQLPAAVKSTFDVKGVHGRFITKTTARYWKDVRGGKKWISMLQSYIDLERMPKANIIRDLACLLQPV